jgi:hypothetical protein
VLTTAGLGSRIVIEVCDELGLGPSEEELSQIAFDKELLKNSVKFEADFHRFKKTYPTLFSRPTVSPIFGNVTTSVDVMLWLQPKFAPGSTLLLSQGGMADGRLNKNGKRSKAAPCWPHLEVVTGERKITTHYLGSYYHANVFHKLVREDKWKYMEFKGSCTRSLKTRWWKIDTYFVWLDLETYQDGKRVPPTPEERAALLEYCRKNGATVVTMSPNGMHVLLIFTRPVSVESTAPMKAVVTWFFRNFPQSPASRWKLDITASVNRARLERACPVVFWDRNAVVDVPAEIIPDVMPAKPGRERGQSSRRSSGTSSKFGSGGGAADSGAWALRLRREAMQFCGLDHIKSEAFMAQIATKVGLKLSEIAELYSKNPLCSETFGPLDVADKGRQILSGAPEWALRRTKKLFSSLAWVYLIFHHRTNCTDEELFTLFRGLVVRPLVPLDAHLPPSGPQMPSHILLQSDRPQLLFENAVLTAFDVTKADLADASNGQAVKANAALEMAKKDQNLESRLCGMLDQAATLLGSSKTLLAWLEKDITRCAQKYWAGNKILASKRRMRLVLQAIATLERPENFKIRDLLPIVRRIIYGQGGRKQAKAEKAASKTSNKNKGPKSKPNKSKKKTDMQIIHRALVELEKHGLVTRHNPSQTNKNEVGSRGGNWGITAVAKQSGKCLKTKGTKKKQPQKECFAQANAERLSVASSLSVPKAGFAKSVVLEPAFETDWWYVGARNHGKGVLFERLEVLVHGIRGFKSTSGVSMWEIEGHMLTKHFGSAAERFTSAVQKAGLVKVRSFCMAQFRCPKIFVPDGNGGQRQLGPVDSYMGAFFGLEIGIAPTKANTKPWFQAGAVTFDEKTGQFNNADMVQVQPDLLPEIWQPAATAWLKKQQFLQEKLSQWKRTFDQIAEASVRAKNTQCPRERAELENDKIEQLGIYYDNVPEDFIRWAANNWVPGAEKTEIGQLLKGLQKFSGQKKRQTGAAHGCAKN